MSEVVSQCKVVFGKREDSPPGPALPSVLCYIHPDTTHQTTPQQRPSLSRAVQTEKKSIWWISPAEHLTTWGATMCPTAAWNFTFTKTRKRGYSPLSAALHLIWICRFQGASETGDGNMVQSPENLQHQDTIMGNLAAVDWVWQRI